MTACNPGVFSQKEQDFNYIQMKFHDEMKSDVISSFLIRSNRSMY